MARAKRPRSTRKTSAIFSCVARSSDAWLSQKGLPSSDSA